MKYAFLFLLFASVASAQQAPKPMLHLEKPERITAYSQPAIYEQWWKEIADCEGLDAYTPLQHLVQFYEVKGTDFVDESDPRSMLAATFPEQRQIFMATPFIWNPKLVKHEMLHQLLYWNGYDFGPWHVAEFYDRCGLAPWGQ